MTIVRAREPSKWWEHLLVRVCSRANMFAIVSVVMAILYVAVSVLCTSWLLTQLVFGPSVLTPGSTIGPRTSNLFALQEAEAQGFPDIEALTPVFGECKSPTADLIKEELRTRIDVARESARLQTEHAVVAWCLEARLPGVAGRESEETRAGFRAVAGACRRQSETGGEWDQCFINAVSGNPVYDLNILGGPNGTEVVDLSWLPSVDRQDLGWCAANWSLPLSALTQVELNADLVGDELVRGIEARSSFDQSYAERRLQEVRGFFDVLASYFTRIGTVNEDVDDYIEDSEEMSEERPGQCLAAANVLRGGILDFSDVMLNTALAWTDEYSLAIEKYVGDIDDWVNSMQLKLDGFQPGGDISAAINGIQDVIGTVDSAINSNWDDIKSGLRIKFKLPAIRFDCKRVNLGFAKVKLCWPVFYLKDVSIPNPFLLLALESLGAPIKKFPRAQLSAPSINLPSVPQLDITVGTPPIPSFPTFAAPEIPPVPKIVPPVPSFRIDPPDVPYELTENWFADDYNPPEILDAEINATIDANDETDIPEPRPVNNTATESFAFVGLELPPLELGNVWIPSFPALGFLNFFILADTLGLLFNTCFDLVRAGAMPEAAMKVNVNTEDMDDVREEANQTPCWAYLYIIPLKLFSPKIMLFLLFFIPWLMFMLFYYALLYGPVQDPQSYVYTTGGAMALEHAVYEAVIYNRYNKQLSGITTECQAGRSAHASEINSLTTELSGWLNSLGVSAAFKQRELGLPEELPDATDYFSHLPNATALPSTGNEICPCQQLSYRPALSKARRIAAIAADAQVFVVINAYVLKVHFIVFLMVILRVTRYRLVRLYAMIVAYFGSPRMQVHLRGPLWTMQGTNAEADLPPLLKMKKEFLRTRGKRFAQALLWVCLSLAAVWIVAYANRTVDNQLINPLGAIGCDVDEDCPQDGLGACEVNTCETAVGVCAIESVICDDGDDCTQDYCSKDRGCVYELLRECMTRSSPPLPACFSNLQLCDDGFPCTRDICIVSESDARRDSADALGCMHELIECDSPVNACLEPSTCDPMIGVCSSKPIDCDDGDACTEDSCDPGSGCLHTPVVCPTNLCYQYECAPANGTCIPVDLAPVDDGHDCTLETCDEEFGWRVSLVDSICADDLGNTTDTCTMSGCSNVFAGEDVTSTVFCDAEAQAGAVCFNCTEGCADCTEMPGDDGVCNECRDYHYGPFCLPCPIDCDGWCDAGIGGVGCRSCDCGGHQCHAETGECHCPINWVQSGPRKCLDCAGGFSGPSCLPV